jgi:hypothetical protein
MAFMTPRFSVEAALYRLLPAVTDDRGDEDDDRGRDYRRHVRRRPLATAAFRA